jgi:hypothetical protein
MMQIASIILFLDQILGKGCTSLAGFSRRLAGAAAMIRVCPDSAAFSVKSKCERTCPV